MPSPESLVIRKTIERDCVPDVPIQEERRQWESYAETLQLPEDACLDELVVARVRCLSVATRDHTGPSIALYVHGGGLISGSSVTHREYACRLARHLQRQILLVDYRLAPEHPFPAALEDVRAVYLELIRTRCAARDIVVGGESSGAGLALSFLVNVKEEGWPLPAAAFFVSGHFDMTLSGESMRSRRDVDPFTSEECLRRAIAFYANGADPASPLISPLHANLGGLPPVLLQVGDHEILLSDSERLARKIETAGGHATLRVWEAMWHNWLMYRGLPEADWGMGEIAEFLQRFSPGPNPSTGCRQSAPQHDPVRHRDGSRA